MTVTTYAVTDTLRIYRDGLLVAEIAPAKFPALIEQLAGALIGRVATGPAT